MLSDSPGSGAHPERNPIELGQSEVLQWGRDIMLFCCGTLLNEALKAAESLRAEGYDVGVVNARFIKPLDREAIMMRLRVAERRR